MAANMNPQGGGAPRLSGQNNKLSLSIKPLVSVQAAAAAPALAQMTTPLTPTTIVKPDQFGFEDDFSSLSSIAHQQQPQPSNTAPSASFDNNSALLYQQQQTSLLLPQPPSRTHRRSASHTSSTSGVFNKYYETPAVALMSLADTSGSHATAGSGVVPDLININASVSSSGMTPAMAALQQQLQYQYQIQQQQQQLQQQQQQQQMQQYHMQQQQQQQQQQQPYQVPVNSLSAQTNSRLLAHSRSASASPK
jgi:hypothetical protein